MLLCKGCSRFVPLLPQFEIWGMTIEFMEKLTQIKRPLIPGVNNKKTYILKGSPKCRLAQANKGMLQKSGAGRQEGAGIVRTNIRPDIYGILEPPDLPSMPHFAALRALPGAFRPLIM